MSETNTNIKIFSVVIAHYNQKNLWKTAVDSILNQNYPAIQIVFADDGSDGFDVAEVEKYIDRNKKNNIVSVVVTTNDRNVGTVRNFNRARAHCIGDYIIHVAADDAYCDQNVFSAFALALENNSNEFCGVYGKRLLCDENLVPTGEEFINESASEAMNGMTAQEQFERLTWNCCIPMGATAFLRDKLDAIGLFDERYTYIEDWPFFLRATRTQNRFLFINIEALLYRAGGVTRETGVFRYRAQCFREHMQIYEADIWPYLRGWSRPQVAELYDFYNQSRMDMKAWAGGFETKTRFWFLLKNPKLILFLLMRWAKTSKKTLVLFLLAIAALVFLQATKLFTGSFLVNLAAVLLSVLLVEGLLYRFNRLRRFFRNYFNKNW